MDGKLIISFIIFSFLTSFVYSQETREWNVMPMSQGTNFRPTLNVENSGQLVGTVKSDKGKVIENAVVVLNNGYFYFDATSNKKGEYKARAMFGEFVVEVSAPGYEKYVGEVYMSKGRTLTRDIVLKPIIKGVEKMKASGNKSLANGNSILFNINGIPSSFILVGNLIKRRFFIGFYYLVVNLAQIALLMSIVARRTYIAIHR